MSNAPHSAFSIVSRIRTLRSAALIALIITAAIGALPPRAEAVVRLGSANTVSLSNGLVGYWTFDGPVTSWNTNTTADISGNGNTGQMINMSTTTSPVPGKIGQALNFNGTNRYINTPLQITPTQYASLSMFAWVKPQTIVGGSAYRSILAGDNGGS